MSVPLRQRIGAARRVTRLVSCALAMALLWALPSWSKTPQPTPQATPQPTMLLAPVEGLQPVSAGDQVDRTAPVEVEPSTRLFLDRIDLETWATQTLGAAEARGQFVGAGVVVFRPEGSVFAKGYGRSAYDQPDRIHPGITYFPAAQLGNLLVAEWLVDLEAKGRLGLDEKADVYLTRVALPPDYRHLRIRDLFGTRTGLTSSERGTHLVRGKTGTQQLGHIKSMLRRSAVERTRGPSSSPLASALASLVAEDVGGVVSETGLGHLLQEKWGATAWFNSQGSQPPNYTSRHHLISRFGKIERTGFHVAAPGFVASQGLYMTPDDMAKILASHLKGLGEKSPATEKVVSLAFERKELESRTGGTSGPLVMFKLRGRVGASSIHVLLIPEHDVGLLAVVNSALATPDFAPGGGRTRAHPPLSASDIVNSFLQQFVSPNEPRLATSKHKTPSLEGLYKKAARPLVGPDRILELLSPRIRVSTDSKNRLTIDGDGPFERTAGTTGTFNNAATGLTATFDKARKPSLILSGELFAPFQRRSSVNGLMALFLVSAVLQFVLLAAARWPAATGGQRLTKWLGMASVSAMTAALAFPVALLVLGHSRTLIDPLYRLSQWAFPMAGVLALATIVACLIGWKKGFWGDESTGFKRRLCFTVGSTGVFGLAIVAWQLNLMLPLP